MVPKHQDFRFGQKAEFAFSRARGLWRSGKPLELRYLERQLLKVLLDRPNETVRKEELRALVWPDTEVTDNTLTVLVARLRKLLGDTEHTVLQTVAKMGYRIIATPELRRVAPVAKEVRRRDGARFVRDVTVPDGSIFEPGEPIDKVWEIQNIGATRWQNRALRRVGTATGRGQIESAPTTRVPETAPGQMCLISMSLKAPLQPGSYYAEWKMIDSNGTLCFPKLWPLFLRIDVVVPRE